MTAEQLDDSTPRRMTSERAPAAPLNTSLEEAARHERQRAVRCLLAQPMLTAEGPLAREFGFIRRHGGWLRDWFTRHPNWSLQVSPELARLRKVPAGINDPTRAVRDERTGLPFSRRRYVLLCLALAALERSERQITLGRLAETVVGLVKSDPVIEEAGIRFELSQQDERRDLVQVIRLLLAHQALKRVAGDEERYLRDQTDVLYNVNRPVLAGFLAVRRGPSTISAPTFPERLTQVIEEPVPDSDEGRNRMIRIGLTRRLLDDPIVYYSTLTEPERLYLSRQRPFILQPLTEATGLVAEVRAEGIALVDPTGEATDLALPEEGTEGHLTLLLAGYLAGRLRRQPGVQLSLASLTSFTVDQIKRHRSHWRRDVTEPGAEVALTRSVVDRLESLALLSREGDQILPLAALGRFGLRQDIPND